MMQLPANVPVLSPKERKQVKEQIARDAEHQRRAIGTLSFRPGRNPFAIAIVVLILLAVGSLLTNRSGTMRQARGDTRSPRMRAIDELLALRTAVERFRRDCGRYPTVQEGLVAIVRDPGVTNWGGPYVNFVKPDPWRNRYVYGLVSDSVTVLSWGPDRKPRTADDLVACEPDPDEINADLETKDEPEEESLQETIPGALPPVRIGGAGIIPSFP